MEAQKRTRRVNRERSQRGEQAPRGARQIVIPMTRTQYDEMWADPRQVRAYVNGLRAEAPELFPAGMAEGYAFHAYDRESRKQQGIRLRQVRLKHQSAYWLRPSFVLSYMAGTVNEVEHALLLASYGVPMWLLTAVFGHNDMYWQRLVGL
ncbi:MAG: hypothetical protein O3C40_36410 [Planctomycetota bacterium]|nr:hypothetical protein [Planctomycetota bacterium]